MSVDYIVSSLPTLTFGQPAPIDWARFAEIAGKIVLPAAWTDLETQLRNVLVDARAALRGDSAAARPDKFKRPAAGCSIFWRNRVLACFQEKNVAKRDELLDRVWWDAAGELTPPESPLGAGALATYAIRLKIALKRTKISKDAGNAAFDRLTAETKVDFRT